VTPETSSWRIDAGTIDTPSSAATRLTTDAICGASWPMIGSKPAARQALMMLS